VNLSVKLHLCFYARKQLLLSACLSHCNSVCLSVTRVDQSKTVQARITKFLQSAARKSFSINLKGVTPNEGAK